MPVNVGDLCKRGHVIAGDNAQQYTNRGKPHVRCATCNKPPTNNAKQPGDVCKHGHKMVDDNLGERKVKGRVQYFCKECKRVQVRKYASSDAGRVASRTKNYDQSAKKQRYAHKKAAERADDLIGKGKEDQALNYLKLAKRAERAAVSLQKAMDVEGPKCEGNPAPYVDYDEESPPSKDEAYDLCKGCPVLVECARFANTYRPEVGVWGGEVYKSGKILYK